uniref:hypothetical protein n=1 Tax=Cellvibrio fontiphilus TaxID=1815559 RepID=UPI002B4C0B0A|nr:hypothetical protein [Cellvibrio fontiphilus]
MNHNKNTLAITSDYTSLTESAKAEINRLNEFAKARNDVTDSPEIYREWAYGVFLFWKKLAGANATPADVLHLETLATGELSS